VVYEYKVIQSSYGEITGVPPLFQLRNITAEGKEAEFCRIFSEFWFFTSPLKNTGVSIKRNFGDEELK